MNDVKLLGYINELERRITALQRYVEMLEVKLDAQDRKITPIVADLEDKLKSEITLIWNFIGGMTEKLEMPKPGRG